VFGVVLELFIVEKQLFAGREYKLGPAVVTLQYSIDEFHGLASLAQGTRIDFGHDSRKPAAPVPCLRTYFHNKGPGRKKFSGKFLFAPSLTGRLEQQ